MSELYNNCVLGGNHSDDDDEIRGTPSPGHNVLLLHPYNYILATPREYHGIYIRYRGLSQAKFGQQNEDGARRDA